MQLSPSVLSCSNKFSMHIHSTIFLVGIECGNPPKPRYGYVKFLSTTFGSKAVYWCQSGYYLVGSSVRYCGDDGHWSGKTPWCKRLYHDDDNDESSSSSS